MIRNDTIGKVCRLKKALYGLVQAAKAFFNEIRTFFVKNGYEMCRTEPCLFKKDGKNGKLVGGFYVDDILLTGTDDMIEEEIRALKGRYDIRVDRNPSEFVGNQLKYEKGSVFIHQKRLIDKMEENVKSELRNIKRNYKTPMQTNEHIIRPTLQEECLPASEQTQYQSGVGTLLYLTKLSRPDISNSVRELSKAMDRANKEAMEKMMRVMKYVLNTKNLGIKLTSPNTNEHQPWVLKCFSDADWAGDPQTRRSVMGWMLFVGGNLIYWSSRQQRIVATSSTEAEYLAVSEMMKELMFIINTIKFLGLTIETPVKVCVDNKGAIFLADNPVVKRSKHIDARYHMIREYVENGIVRMIFVTSKTNAADILTKSPTTEIFEAHRQTVMCHPCQVDGLSNYDSLEQGSVSVSEEATGSTVLSTVD